MAKLVKRDLRPPELTGQLRKFPSDVIRIIAVPILPGKHIAIAVLVGVSVEDLPSFLLIPQFLQMNSLLSFIG